MEIELPDFVPPAPPHVDSSKHRMNSIPDVWRRYDVDKADRTEPAAPSVPTLVEPA